MPLGGHHRGSQGPLGLLLFSLLWWATPALPSPQLSRFTHLSLAPYIQVPPHASPQLHRYPKLITAKLEILLRSLLILLEIPLLRPHVPTQRNPRVLEDPLPPLALKSTPNPGLQTACSTPRLLLASPSRCSRETQVCLVRIAPGSAQSVPAHQPAFTAPTTLPHVL